MHCRTLVTVLASWALLTDARVGDKSPPPEDTWDDEEALVQELADRMKPRDLSTHTAENPECLAADPRQFFHLHHMKTGGTSINHMMNCALRRLRSGGETPMEVPFYSLSECSRNHYQQCITDPHNRCRDPVHSSAVMTYCAPLFQTNEFEWKDADAITVLRDPVERVWSMFRFETKSCFKCMNLTDFYQHVDDGTVESLFKDEGEAKLCSAQLMNHQTRNLLTSPMSQDFTEQDQLEQALDNMRNRFTVVGLTEELPTTVEMFGHAFPWLAPHLVDDPDDSQDCPLPHANKSPSNNACGPDQTHWDLPDHPDEETRRVILEHNQLDMKLYEAAVQHFELQKRALGWGEDVN